MRLWIFTALWAIGFGVGVSAAPVDDYYQDAQARLQANEIKAAIIQLKNGLQSDPTHLPSRLLLGRIYLDQGDAASAEKELRRGESLGAPRDRWESGLGEALLLQGKFSELLQELTTDIQRRPAEQAVVLTLRGRALIGDGQLENARLAFVAAAELAPDSPDPAIGMARLLVVEKRPEQAGTLLDEVLAKHPANADALSMKGQLAFEQGEGGEALDLFNRALLVRPAHAEALLGRAGVLAQKGDLDAASADLAMLARQRQGYIPAAYLQSVVAFKRGDLDLAQSQVDIVLRAFPGHTPSLVLRGVISFIRGEDEIARQFLEYARSNGASGTELNKLMGSLYISAHEYERVVALLGREMGTTTDIQVLALLGSAYMGLGQDDLAFQAYGRAIELAPDVTQLRTHLGISLMQAGKSEQGMEMLQSAVEAGEDSLNPEMILVMGYLKAGNREAARDAALALEAKFPQSPRALNLSGLVLLANNDAAGAQQRFEQVLSLQPDFPLARINIARVALARNDPAGAREQFEKVLESHPDYLNAMIGMIALADNAGDTTELELWVGKAMAAHPQAIQPRLVLLDHYLRMQMVQPAVQLATELALAYPTNPTVLYQLGRAQLENRQFAEASRSFETVSRLDPSNPDAWVRLGQSLTHAGKGHAAEQALRQALALEPDHLEALSRLAALEAAQGRMEQAQGMAARLIQKYPDKAEGYRLSGVIHYRAGQAAEALQALDKAYAIEPTSDVAGLLADLHSQQGNPGVAAEVLEGWLRGTPDDRAARERLAGLYMERGESAKAEQQYLAMIAQRPDDFVALNNLAWLQYDRGSPEAVATARKAYEFAPGNPAVIDTYGWLLFKTGGDRNEALRLLQQGVLISPRDPEIGFHLASVMASTGRQSEAAVILRRLLRESPRAEQADEARALLGRLGG